MWKSRFRFLIFMVFVITLCTACQSEPAIETTHNDLEITYEEVYMRIVEPYGSGFVLQGNMLRAVIGEHTYEFESTISETSRAMFVKNQEQLCIFLNKNGVSTAGLTFRILENHSNWTDSEIQTAYYGVDCAKSWEQVLTTIQVCLGDYTNYGYLYALSNRIATALQWICDDTPLKNGEVFVDVPNLLNLVYPCFSEKYCDINSVDACKALAVELLDNTENIWSEEEFLRARVEYSQLNGIDFQPTYLTFGHYSQSCPLKLQTKYLEIFMDKTFRASNEFLDGYIKEDYMADLGSFIRTFEWLDRQLTNYRDIFAVTEDVCVPVHLTNELPSGYLSVDLDFGGLFVSSGDSSKIYATTATCLAHEYVHYLFWQCGGTDDSAYQTWHTEVVARYYTLAGAFEQRKLISTSGQGASIELIESLIGQAYDEPSDEVRFIRCALRTEDVQYLSFLKTNYQACAAFGEYFVRAYGENVFLNSMMYPSRVEEFTGLSMDEVVEAWIADMRNPEND